jgi:hypothetical protein
VVQDLRYLQGFVWGRDVESPGTPSVMATEYHDPLPGVPEDDYIHELVMEMVKQYAHLFKIVLPVRPRILESLLCGHPNRPLVDSVIEGFQDGFWPSARAD